MTPDVALHHRVADRHAVVDEVQAAVPGARIVVARLVVAVRQFDERYVLAQRDGFRRRRHARDGAREEPAAASTAAAGAAAARSAFVRDLLRPLRRTASPAASTPRLL